MGAWDAAGVPGPTLTPGWVLAALNLPAACQDPPTPVLLAPLVAWDRAAPAPRAHCGLQDLL